jgi:hypothetical protein
MFSVSIIQPIFNHLAIDEIWKILDDAVQIKLVYISSQNLKVV